MQTVASDATRCMAAPLANGNITEKHLQKGLIFKADLARVLILAPKLMQYGFFVVRKFVFNLHCLDEKGPDLGEGRKVRRVCFPPIDFLTPERHSGHPLHLCRSPGTDRSHECPGWVWTLSSPNRHAVRQNS